MFAVDVKGHQPPALSAIWRPSVDVRRHYTIHPAPMKGGAAALSLNLFSAHQPRQRPFPESPIQARDALSIHPKEDYLCHGCIERWTRCSSYS